MGVRNKMAKGAFWLFLEKGAQQISSFVVFAVIARMIGPAEYGLVALCGMVMTLVNNITSGLVDAVISMHIRDDERLSSLFWVVTTGGAFLSLFSFGVAEPFAALFGQEKLVGLLKTYAVLPFLFSLSAVPTALITATMDFKIFTIRTLFAALIGGAVGIWGAWHGWGAYALAAQQIVAQVAIAAVVWKGLAWKPRMMFSTRALGEMLKLGAGQTGSLMLSFLETQAPRFALGYLLGPVAVGYYAFVVRLCVSIQEGVIQPVLGVVYPAVVELMNNQEKKKEVIGQIIFAIGIIMLPVVVGIVMTAPVIVPLFFGSKWVSATTAVQIFILNTIFSSFCIALKNILRAHREIGLYLKYQFLLAIGGTVLYFILGSHGVEAVAIVRFFIAFTSAIIFSVLVWKRTKVNVMTSYLSLGPVLIATATMIIFIVATQGLLKMFVHPAWMNFLLCLTIGGASYLSALCLLKREALKKVWAYIREKHNH